MAPTSVHPPDDNFGGRSFLTSLTRLIGTDPDLDPRNGQGLTDFAKKMPKPNTAFICTLLNFIPGLPSNMFKLFFSFLTVFSLFYAQSCDVATTRGALQAVHVRGRQRTATCDVTARGRPCPSRERLSPSRCQGNVLTPSRC